MNCKRCGYCLDYIHPTRCPECGATVDIERGIGVVTDRQLRRRRALRRGGIVLLALICVAGALFPVGRVVFASVNNGTRTDICLHCGRVRAGNFLTLGDFRFRESWTEYNSHVTRWLGTPHNCAHEWHIVEQIIRDSDGYAVQRLFMRDFAHERIVYFTKYEPEPFRFDETALTKELRAEIAASILRGADRDAARIQFVGVEIAHYRLAESRVTLVYDMSNDEYIQRWVMPILRGTLD